MKVFTHYTKLGSTSDGIRWRTILKFGNSWELKGSVVMRTLVPQTLSVPIMQQ